MSVISVDGGCFRHSLFCRLDKFHYTPLSFLLDDPLVGGNWIGCLGALDREGEFVHSLLCVGRRAHMFTLRLNSLSLLETRDIINPLSNSIQARVLLVWCLLALLPRFESCKFRR